MYLHNEHCYDTVAEWCMLCTLTTLHCIHHSACSNWSRVVEVYCVYVEMSDFSHLVWVNFYTNPTCTVFAEKPFLLLCKIWSASYGSKRITTSFWYDLLCILKCMLVRVTQKLQVVYGHSTYQTTALQLEMSILCVRSAYEIWFVSYGSKHASQSLSAETHCAYLHAELENYRLSMDVLHIK